MRNLVIDILIKTFVAQNCCNNTLLNRMSCSFRYPKSLVRRGLVNFAEGIKTVSLVG
jgi:hypothetical protein